MKTWIVNYWCRVICILFKVHMHIIQSSIHDIVVCDTQIPYPAARQVFFALIFPAFLPESAVVWLSQPGKNRFETCNLHLLTRKNRRLGRGQCSKAHPAGHGRGCPLCSKKSRRCPLQHTTIHRWSRLINWTDTLRSYTSNRISKSVAWPS